MEYKYIVEPKEQNSLIDRNELRRLQKAAREKDLRKLAEWSGQLEEQMRQEYNKAFEQELSDAIENFCVAIVYTLHFNEQTKYGNKRINDFMDDLFTTIDLFRTKEYNPEDYKQQLKDDNITIFDD